MSLYKKTKKYPAKVITLVIIFVSLLAVFYITNDKSAILTNIDEDNFQVKITVTKDYGQSTVFEKHITVEAGETAMDALEKVSDIKTSHSGGFVESINGIKSTYLLGKGTKNDWFFYINGMLSPFGSADYILHPNDIVRWDYQYWGSDIKTTAIIADYPEPFLHGFHGKIRDNIIVYSNNFYEESYKLKQSLNNLSVSVFLKNFNELSNTEKSNNNLILIDTFNNPLIQELNNNREQIGWFIKYSDGILINYNFDNEKESTFDHGGVIAATQNPWNPKGNWNGENVVWIISGINIEDVNQAVNVLLSKNYEFKNCMSLIIKDEIIYKVP